MRYFKFRYSALVCKLIQLNMALAMVFISDFTYGSKNSSLAVLLEKWPTEVHPARLITLESVLISNQVYETLISISSSGELVPQMLNKWEYFPGTKRFRFYLKNNIVFSDGTKVTSEKIQTVFEKIVSTKYMPSFHNIKGAKEYFNNKSKQLKGFKKVDPYIFDLEFENENPRFLEELADPHANIYLESREAIIPYGTGPYKFLEINKEQQKIVLGYNTFYNVSKPDFQKIIFMINNSVDSTSGSQISFKQPIENTQNNLQESKYLDTEVVFLGFNIENSKLASLNVRKSISSLLSSNLIDESIGPEKYSLGGFIPLGTPGHQPSIEDPTPIPENVALPKSISIFNYLEKYKTLANKFCKELAKKKTVCTVLNDTPDKLSIMKNNGTLELFIVRQKPTSYNPEYLLSTFTSNSVFNLFTSRNRSNKITNKFDNLFEQIILSARTNKDQLIRQYKEMDSEIIKSALIKPIRYGANKSIWVDNQIYLPSINTLGPFGLKMNNIKHMRNNNE